jgi:hypothetical protein
MSDEQGAEIPQQIGSEKPLYIRFAKRADMAVMIGDRDLALLLIEGVFLAMDEMIFGENYKMVDMANFQT